VPEVFYSRQKKVRWKRFIRFVVPIERSSTDFACLAGSDAISAGNAIAAYMSSLEGGTTMSVAFVREESAEAAQEVTLPLRTISAHPNLVTQSGLRALERAPPKQRRRAWVTRFELATPCTPYKSHP
jgi:hypothetical protein